MPSNPPDHNNRPVVLGMRFDALTVPQALDRFFELAKMPPGPRGCRIAATVNVDFVVNTYCSTKTTPRNPALANILRRAELVIADGMPLVWLSRLLGTPLPERVTGSDMVPLIAERAARDHVKLYFFGGTEENTRRAAEILTERYPGLEIAGMTGMFLGGAVYHVPVIIDGVISAAAAAIAYQIRPVCAEYMLASHCSGEPAASGLLQMMRLKPVIDAGLRLGEGTGGRLLLPLLDGALALYRHAQTFEEENIERSRELS